MGNIGLDCSCNCNYKNLKFETIKDILYLITHEEEDLRGIINYIVQDEKKNPIDSGKIINNINIVQSSLTQLCIFLYEVEKESNLDSSEESEFCGRIDNVIFTDYYLLKERNFPEKNCKKFFIDVKGFVKDRGGLYDEKISD